MNEGLLKKRIKDLRDKLMQDYETPSDDAINNIIDEAKKDIFDYFRRGLVHEGLVKWFGT